MSGSTDGNNGGRGEEAICAIQSRAPRADRDARRLRRFTVTVTVAMMVACNAVFLLGLWGSEINLDTLIRTPDVFNPEKDICLRMSWHKVSGIEKPVQLCYEWINTTDRSGQTHTFQPDTAVIEGADGHLYLDSGPRVDYRLFLLVGYVVAIVLAGITVQRRVIARYRRWLQEESSD